MTSNSNNTLERIKLLIAAWYDGSVSAEDEAELMRLLAAAEDLPKDLEQDKHIIEAMHKRVSEQMPSDLENRILSATCDKKEQKSRFFVYFTRCVSAAACIVAAVCTFLWIDKHQESNLAMPMQDAVAVHSNVFEKSDSVATDEAVVAEQEQVAVATIANSPKVSKISVEQTDVDYKSSNLVCAEDSVEAVYYAGQAMAMVENALGLANRKMAAADRSLRSSLRNISNVDN